MKFYKLIRYDLRNGFFQNRFRLLAIILLVLASCMDFYLRKNLAYHFENLVPDGTFMDYTCFLLGGIPEFILGVDESFIFPVKWFLFHLLLLYGTLHYSSRDLFSCGITILPRSGNRVLWWLSKCIWNCCYVVMAYLTSFLAIFIFCAASGESLSLSVTPEYVNQLMGARSPFTEFPLQLTVLILFLPLFISIGNSLIQMLLTLFIKPMFSFGMLAAFLLCGAYLNCGLFWSTYAMPVRSKWIAETGFSFMQGMAVSILVAAAAILTGCIRFQRYSILDTD